MAPNAGELYREIVRDWQVFTQHAYGKFVTSTGQIKFQMKISTNEQAKVA